MGRPRIYKDDNERKRVWDQKNRRGIKQPVSERWPAWACFLDGEAYEDRGYCLLQTFDPRTGEVHTTERNRRLSTEECFQHLYLTPPAYLFGYGLKYDVSNWFADLPRDVLERLRATGHSFWKQYKIDFLQGKMLQVVDRNRERGDKRRTVFDLAPFYQQAFIQALKDSAIEVPDIIQIGKRLRGKFMSDNAEFVKEYNIAELRAMELLFNSLGKTLKAGNCRIKYWFGPGSCARYYAEKHNVSVDDGELTKFLNARRDLRTAGIEPVELAEQRAASPHAACVDAFYGGRFELSRQGCFDQCWEYDLASAYPWALSQGMPCFACGGEWRRLEEWNPAARWAVWNVGWDTPNKKALPVWGPLPVRLTRNLAWCRSGIGWYHTVEVAAAMRHLADRYQFKVWRGWEWVPACDHDPWAWVGSAAAERVAIKESNPGKAQCLKLVLNSCYGITADKAGVVNGRRPRYHNPYWAGLITARTRARLIEASAVGWDDIIYLATDGVHSRVPLNLPVGPNLGDWEPPKRCGIPAVFLAPGTYLYEDGKRGKSRGINLGKFSQDIRTWQRLYRMTAPHGRINLSDRHFIPFGEAVARCRASDSQERYEEIVNTWVTRPRILSYDLTPRRQADGAGGWVAPPYDDWLLLGQILVTPNDQMMIDEEVWAGYQPEWAVHPLDVATDA